jgi:hypothetical protein
MVLAKVSFNLFKDTPMTALLTKRGWTVLHDSGRLGAVFDLIAPFVPDPLSTDGAIGRLAAERLAGLLGGAVVAD